MHSGRVAASSCALLLGLPIDAISKQAGWKSKSTFVQNYMKTPLILREKLEDKHNFSTIWNDKESEHYQVKEDKKIDRFL